jgi:hypothetical protein
VVEHVLAKDETRFRLSLPAHILVVVPVNDLRVRFLSNLLKLWITLWTLCIKDSESVVKDFINCTIFEKYLYFTTYL